MYQCDIPLEETATCERERLIMERLPQVGLIARRFHERLPSNVSLDDLVSTGIVGLISAIDNFDPSQGVQLKTYAEYKIRGAILDSLRGMDWASRHRRKKARSLEGAMEAASQRLQRAPTEEEVAAELNLPLEEYHDRLREVQGLSLESLEMSVGPRGDQNLLAYIPDTEELSPLQAVERSELERILAQAIDHMPEIERTILSLYYKEELLLREIAQVLNMRITRVSELKTQGILRLRAVMTRKWPSTRGAVV
jgi:RNA polymerase sigma factor for flagellar operon FliA